MTSSKPARAHARAAKRFSQAAKVGLAPGALIHLGERKTEQAAISLMEYGEAEFAEHGSPGQGSRGFQEVAARRGRAFRNGSRI